MGSSVTLKPAFSQPCWRTAATCSMTVDESLNANRMVGVLPARSALAAVGSPLGLLPAVRDQTLGDRLRVGHKLKLDRIRVRSTQRRAIRRSRVRGVAHEGAAGRL